VSGSRSRVGAGLLLLGLVVALLLRLSGLWTELWMDEILSIRLVEPLASPLGVFTEVRSDNNHYLNSLWLWAVGTGAPPWLMRLPPLVFGVLLVPVAYRVARPAGKQAAAITASLFAVSYPLVHYATEARGYGYLVLLTLLAYGLFRSWVSDGKRWAGVAYAVVSVAAFLAHLGFVTVFAAFLVWSAVEVAGARPGRWRPARRHALVQALPALAALLLYVVDVRHMNAAGGFARMSPAESLAGAVGLIVGVAPGLLPALVAAGAWVAVVLAARRAFVGDRAETVFMTTAILLALVSGALPGYGYPRYYLTALLFALLLLGRWISTALETGAWRSAAIALFVLVGGINLSQVYRFAAVGRGQYREAATYMAAETGFRPVTVAGSHDMGSILALEHYGAELPGRTEFVYYCHSLSTYGCSRERPSRARGDAVPEYYLLSSLEDAYEAPPSLEIPDMDRYEFVHSFPKYGLSGIHWSLYRLTGSAPR